MWNEKPDGAKMRKSSMLMIAGSLFIIVSWGIGLPQRFQLSSLQLESQSLAEDMTSLKNEVDAVAKEPTPEEAMRMKEKLKDIERRTQNLNEDLGGAQRFEGYQMLGAAFGCVLTSSGLVLRLFRENAVRGVKSSSGSDGPAVSDGG